MEKKYQEQFEDYPLDISDVISNLFTLIIFKAAGVCTLG